MVQQWIGMGKIDGFLYVSSCTWTLFQPLYQPRYQPFPSSFVLSHDMGITRRKEGFVVSRLRQMPHIAGVVGIFGGIFGKIISGLAFRSSIVLWLYIVIYGDDQPLKNRYPFHLNIKFSSTLIDILCEMIR